MIRKGLHLRVLSRIDDARVPYLLMGVLAIGHYALESGEAYLTDDCDILIRPRPRDLSRVLDALTAERYALSCGGESLPWPDRLIARRLVEHRAVVRAKKRDCLGIDIMLVAAGASFAELWKRREIFHSQGVRIKCASLEDLLASKARAGRPKDKAFLTLYYANLGTEYPPKGRSKGARRRR